MPGLTPAETPTSADGPTVTVKLAVLLNETGSCCGGTSAGIEPIPANIYSHKTLSGTFAVKNPYLEAVLEEKGINTEATWASILEHEGSVQHLDALTQDEKDVYKTAFELDQRWIIELAADPPRKSASPSR